MPFYEGAEPALDEVAPVGELPVPALREPCPRCDGLGWLWEAHCRWSCVPALLTDAEYTDEFALLPCGHAVALASERACPRCQGQGVVGLEPDLAALGLCVPETLDEALVVIERLIGEVARWRASLDDAVEAWWRRLERERAQREKEVTR